MKPFFLTMLAVCSLFALGSEEGPLKTVESVELKRYLGKWYEIARFPNVFQKDCDLAEANYALREDGTISVINTCSPGEKKERKSIEGTATIVDPQTNAKLKVSFVPAWLRWTGIGWGDYWIIDLGTAYEYAVVSEPKRKFLWILNRNPKMPRKLYEEILTRIQKQGLDVSQLIPSGPNLLQ